MRKNLLSVAVMVTAFFVGTTIAQAVSVQWGGELRPRFEYVEQRGFNGTPAGSDGNQTSGDYFTSSRIRLHAKADILPDTSAFIQLQSVRTWGSANGSFQPNDGDTSVGVHQAYFTLKNFATLPVDLKVGRQEVVLDGHRLLGNTGWTQGAQTHDAVRVTHHEGNHTLAYVYATATETAPGAAPTGLNQNDDGDVDAHVVYANMQGILGGGLSLYFVHLDDSATLSNSGTVFDNNFSTVGARQAGQLFGLDYRAEYYYQFGDAEGATLGLVKGIDREAYMIGARVGKKFNNVMWKPSVTLWYDYLSGSSDDDIAGGDFGSFNTLFDTGHKFYGFMDLFLGVGGGGLNGTAGLGLVDYAVKTSIQPAKNWKVKADYHLFQTAESIGANNTLTTASQGVTGAGSSKDLGSEIDLTLVHKYNANTTISAGWSHFWQEEGFEVVNSNASSTANNTTADWAYLMFDVKF